MQRFSDVVRSLQRGEIPGSFQSVMASQEGMEYVRAPERLTEAEAVGPCVWWMAYGELDRTQTLTASRTPTPVSPPSLARKLGRRIADAPVETYAALIESIYRSTAVGYVSMLHREALGAERIFMKRSTEDIWNVWSRGFRDMLEEGPSSKEWAHQIRTFGGDSLIHDLKALGLTRLLGSLRLNTLGMIYAQAGVWLRVSQTNEMDDAFFKQTVGFVNDYDDRNDDRPCRFDVYPDEDAKALNGLRIG